MRNGNLTRLLATTFSLPSAKVVRAVLLSLFATTSLAQTATTGRIVGRVVDADGVAVPNVTLTFTSVNLIGVRSAMSGKDGVFRIWNIPPGMYSANASIEGGLITSEGNSVEVNISKTSSLFILVPWHRENRSTTAKGQQSHKTSRAQADTNSQRSDPSPISTNESNTLGKPTSILRSPENEAEAKKYDNPSGTRVGISEPSSDPVPAVPRPATSGVELTQIYRVGIGDVLDIWLSKAPTNTSTLFTISPHGVLEHPILAHPLKVAGLTPEEIRRKIKAELKSLAIDQNPEVLVGVREYVSHTIIVSGLVQDPGTKVLRREAIPLYVVLADAQPMLEAGRAAIVSKETGALTTVELSDEKALSLVVRPGDVINVQATPQQFLYIGGEVKAPGEKPFRRSLTLTQAILAAGGLSRKCREAQVAREGTNGRLAVASYKLEEINSGKLPDPLIQPGDRITVVH